ncbi:hypothetical protein CVIRNUC_007219 [Coccomyxa viridis]|uniref:Serine/threonine-protein kinase RIO2 n=1 Tax=Coccomyxa viridis TaxID=1274662 RepID=A0AAV1IAX4_9CHLO|nr:hypothetical protein CVIRNUC_007219 [Coccomyxa viridis]
MKLDANSLRYMSKEEYRTLQALELGQRNHEIVPVPLIDGIAKLRHGGVVNALRGLMRQKLVHHDNQKYDGYRLTSLGYDFLALKALVNRGAVSAVGRQIGVGKESDVFEVLDTKGEAQAVKLHRLGRTSFRAVKAKRDYLQHRTSFSWLYLSRLAAAKEYAFMKALHENGFPVPRPLEHNRHAVLMSLIDATPLCQVQALQDVGRVYNQTMVLLTSLAKRGLVHCDFNEFNILVDEACNITLIDFPQMVSTAHVNAEELFDRDAESVRRFFGSKLGYVSPADPPGFKATLASANQADALDIKLSASGFKQGDQDALDVYMKPQQVHCTSTPSASSSASSVSDSIDEDEGRSLTTGHVGSAQVCDNNPDSPAIGAVVAGPAAWTQSGDDTSKHTSMEGNEIYDDTPTSSYGSRSHAVQCL